MYKLALLKLCDSTTAAGSQFFDAYIVGVVICLCRYTALFCDFYELYSESCLNLHCRARVCSTCEMPMGSTGGLLVEYPLLPLHSLVTGTHLVTNHC